jgi:hypothetical protein
MMTEDLNYKKMWDDLYYRVLEQADYAAQGTYCQGDAYIDATASHRSYIHVIDIMQEIVKEINDEADNG